VLPHFYLGHITNVGMYSLQELLKELAEVTEGSFHSYSSTAEVRTTMCSWISFCRFWCELLGVLWRRLVEQWRWCVVISLSKICDRDWSYTRHV